MASNYSISVDVLLNASGVQSQVNQQLKGLINTGSDIGLTFQQANMIMSKCIDTISDMVDQVYELDTAVREFSKVSDLTGSSLDNYIDKLSELGDITARTTSEMVDAATQFKRAGFSDEDAANLSVYSTMLQNVSDGELAVAESTDFIISQMKAFGMEVEDAEHIIDAVNETAANFAVSTNDLTTNISKASAALAVGNNTYEETIGLFTAGYEITRQASRTSRGLVSIQSRLNQVVDQSSTVGKALTEWYKEHNIAIYDQEGQLMSLYDVLGQVAEIWPTLSTNSKDYYLNQQAGANQTQNLAAILSNFQTAIDATATALDSAGSAAAQNEIHMESLNIMGLLKTSLIAGTP